MSHRTKPKLSEEIGWTFRDLRAAKGLREAHRIDVVGTKSITSADYVDVTQGSKRKFIQKIGMDSSLSNSISEDCHDELAV